MYKSETIDSGYTKVLEKKFSSDDEEGQRIIRLDNGKYRLYVSNYGNNFSQEYFDFNNLGDETPINHGIVNVLGYDKTITMVDVLDFNRPYSFEEV